MNGTNKILLTFSIDNINKKLLFILVNEIKLFIHIHFHIISPRQS